MKSLSTVVFLSLSATLSLGSCSSKGVDKTATGTTANSVSVNYLPNARIYRMSGDCPELVPVSVSKDGRTLISYPAPTDLTEGSTPVQLADGWWLDRRGVSADTRFTDYTYAQYRALQQAPSPTELLNRLSADCSVTEIRELPMNLTEALNDTARVNELIRKSLDDCKVVYALPVFRFD